MVKLNQWQSEDTKNHVQMDLQHFADPAPAGDTTAPTSFSDAGDRYLSALAGSAEETPVVTDVPDAITTPVQSPVQSTNTPTPPADVVELFRQKGVTKFTDPAKFVDSYLAQEQWNTRLSQEKKALAQQVADLRAQATQPPTPAPTPPGAPMTTSEPMDPDAFLAKMYENPEEAMAPFKEAWKQEILRELQPMLNPLNSLVAKGQADDVSIAHSTAAEHFFRTTPGADMFIEQMTDILAADPAFNAMADTEQIVDVMGKTLTYVKGLAYKAPLTTEELIAQLLGNDELFSKHISSNPAIRGKLLSQAVKDVQGTKVPPMMTSSGGAQLVTQPYDTPTSFAALGERVKKAMGIT